MEEINEEGSLEIALDIDADYVRLPSEIAQRIEKIQDQIEGREYEVARDNILSLMKIGGEALSDISSIAQQTSHPRMFEVFTELMKTMIHANRELMEVKRIEEKSKEGSGDSDKVADNRTNILINCTPAQMLEIMKKAKDGKDG